MGGINGEWAGAASSAPTDGAGGGAIDSNRRTGVDWGQGGVAKVNPIWQGVVPVLVALIAAGGVLGSVLGNVHIWHLEENAQRLEQERLRQESLYGGLPEGVLLIHSRGSGAAFVVESQRAWLYASDDVLSAVAGYRRELLGCVDDLGSLNNEQKQRLHRAVAKILLAMRKELCRDTTIDQGWAEEEWPWIGSDPVEVESYL